MNSTFTECYGAIPAGTYDSGVKVGQSNISVLQYCVSTCQNCSILATNCTTCNLSQNRQLVNNSCVPDSGYF